MKQSYYKMLHYITCRS